MPELPEVETVRRGLSKLISGKTIRSIDFDWAKSFPNSPADVKQFVIGARIVSVRRRAKVLMVDLDTNYSLVIHLKMTGQLVYRSKDNKTKYGAGHPSDSLIGVLPDKSTRVILCLQEKGVALESDARRQLSTQGGVHMVQRLSTGVDDTAGGQERWQCPPAGGAGQCDAHLFFNDQRKFGWMKLIPTIEIENIDFFKKLGPEPLSRNFTFEIFQSRLDKRKNSSIKAVLLDQTTLAGIGNIYADETLFASRIHPLSRVADLKASEKLDLYQNIKSILNLSIKLGGSTDKNYVDAEGNKGSYLKFAKVFRLDGQTCQNCGTIIQKIKVAGRGTHICPNCQQIQGE